jgi:hypothetical protein
MSRKSQCKRDYRREGNLLLEDRAEGVKTGIYTNATPFTAPPITQVVFAANILNYANTRKAHEQGGTAQLPAFTAARKVMMGNLDAFATYVDGVANGDKQIIKLAGFAATYDDEVLAAKGGGKAAPQTPQNVTFKRVENQSGQMIAECEAYPSTCNFITLLTENNPLPASVVVDTTGNITIPNGATMDIVINANKLRRKLFTGLTTGSTYYVYYIIINSKGASSISEGKKMLCG